MVAAQWLAQGSKAGEAIALAAHRLPDPAGGWSMQFPADPRALGGLRTGLRGWLAGLGADPADRADVELAVWEAAVNAAVHGRAGPGAGTVSVQAGLDGAGNVLIRVADQGQWRLGGTAAPGHGWAGGRGLSANAQVTDEVSIAPGPAGTTVTIRRGASPGLTQPGSQLGCLAGSRRRSDRLPRRVRGTASEPPASR